MSQPFVDGRAGRVFASGPLSGTAQLAVFAARDGRLVESKPIEREERLIALDRARGRVALWRPSNGLRWLDGQTLALVGQVALPTPDAADDEATRYNVVGAAPRLPIVDPRTGNITIYHGRRLETRDGSTGALMSTWDVPLPDADGPIVAAALSADGELIYLAVADHDLAGFDARSGAILAAFDRASGALVERRNLRATVTHVLSWGDSWLVEGRVHKAPGTWLSLWAGGHERRRLVGVPEGRRWLAVDSRRGRLIGSERSHRVSYATGLWYVVGDPATLDLHFVAPTRFDPPLTEWDDPPLTAYDESTDALFGHGRAPGQLNVVAAARLAPEPIPADTPAPHQTARVKSAVLPAAPGTAEPLAYVGIAAATTAVSNATSGWDPRPDIYPVVRLGSVAAWRLNRPAGVPMWPEAVVAAPSASETDRKSVWFGLLDDVVRSTDGGRSWWPASAGIGTLPVRELDVSPDFARDATLFATSFTTVPADGHDDDPTATAWRSRDGGKHWEPIGRFAALAVSPDFAHDRTVMAFGHLDPQFYVSTDGGTNWRTRGALSAAGPFRETPYPGDTWIVPAADGRGRVVVALATRDTDYGGSPHWPEARTVLYRSTDDGVTWGLAWAPEQMEQSENDTFDSDAMLFGPSDGRLVLRTSLYSAGALLSDDDGRTWYEAWLPDEPDAVPLAAGPAGIVLGAGARSGTGRTGVSVRPLSDFVARATAEH